MTQSLWYVVHVRPNCERKTSEALAARGYDTFLPVSKRMGRSVRRKVIETPLFPGYVFCLFDGRNLVNILGISHVVRVLSRENKPVPLEESEIFALQSFARAGIRMTSTALFQTGQKVKILEGAFSGVECEVIRDDEKPRLVVSVPLLNRSVIAEIDRDLLCVSTISADRRVA